MMRAIIILCLLEFEFGYSWQGPIADVSENGKDSPEEECVTDQASCGCCIMQQQMRRMEMFLNTSLNELEKELEKTQNTFNNIRASRSAFSVALFNSDELRCHGPFRDDMFITYTHIFLNLGGGYDVNTGVFTVPRAGVYSLALTVYSDTGSPAKLLAACASLRVNSRVVANLKEKNTQDQEDSASVAVALQLEVGDKVAATLPAGCFLCDDKSHYNTFTGFLLYATD
ncbi:cerebellin 20 [Dunckerocampus dactyliophorus]|uniref:cerebellin 20 n=1 Tax=Dunckerocampus dactyliophorus TaxID=161453 RepID=UPI00240676EA|nr:cerebellin 20 [Dunckerocampus dactyliophorus]